MKDSIRKILGDPGLDKCKCGHKRRDHGSDKSWCRCANTACKYAGCDCNEFEEKDD